MPSTLTDYEFDIVLRDGSTLRLRPARRSDERGIRELFARLSHDSLYSRFFRIPKLPTLDVSEFLRADPDHAFTLIGESNGEATAIAGYVRDARAPDRAEVAASEQPAAMKAPHADRTW